jgi:putative hemolysin
MKYVMILGLVAVLLLSGCASTLDNKLACTEEAKICSDGSAVGRTGANCEFADCPVVDEKTYVSNDTEQCKVIKFMCVQGTQPFNDEKGCGCEPITGIANPASKFCTDNGGTLEIKTAADGSQSGFCTLKDGTVCDEWAYFRGECPATGGKLQAIDCPTERTQACTREYMPVCGQVQVQCIRAPCPPIKQTFSNKCEACANSLTISYTEGACPDDKEKLCTNTGGTWTGYDCEGLTQEQCTNIGGQFNECASACRNDPTAQVCTLQCVQVCEFRK